MAGEPACFNLPIEAIAYIGLGTNLGDRRANLTRALAAIGRFATIEALSRVYETEPVGFVEQPDFWNAVARVRTTLEPADLFDRLKRVEAELGRTESFRNAPRLIDLDILTYDELVEHTPRLEIPHPRMHERSFVLAPLAELDPDFRMPGTGQLIAELQSSLGPGTRAVPLDDVTLEGF